MTAVVDLFAGPGGTDTGLRMVGVTDALGIDWDASTCETARAAGHQRVLADVSEQDPVEVGGRFLEGLVASPTCRPFSGAGTKKGMRDVQLLLQGVAEMASGRDPRADLHSKLTDERSMLALEPLRWALDLHPEWMMWEQVPSVLPLWRACGEAFKSAGYSVWTGILNAEQFGVPQARKRSFLLASRQEHVRAPTPTHSQYHPRTPWRLDIGVRKWERMDQTLARHGIWRHTKSIATSTRPRATIRPASAPAPTIAFGNDAASFVWVPRGTTADQITALKLSDVPRLTIQEATILQTFPADYPWRGPQTSQYRQVSDAVPPLLAAHCFQALGVGVLSHDQAA